MSALASRRIQVIDCLVEGKSIRSTGRMTDTHRDTAMRLVERTTAN
jgi:transposase-like protein